MSLLGKPKTLIPKGMATFLPEGTARRRAIERKILSLFSKRGYQEIITPAFEYLDVFALGTGDALLDRAYKFVDRATGRMMVLRPDATPQIARMAATLLCDRPHPLRLCYATPVFRHEEEHAGREREIFQIGAELIGASGPAADAEMIHLAMDVLRALGLTSFKVALGQMAFTRGVLSELEKTPNIWKKALRGVAKKEAALLADDLQAQGCDPALRQRVLSLLDLLGGKEVLERARALTDAPDCAVALAHLKAVYARLARRDDRDAVLIDLGEVRGFDYYTGCVFEFFAEGVGAALGGGGRYDRLVEKFGAPAPAVGFAFDVERLQTAQDASPSG